MLLELKFLHLQEVVERGTAFLGSKIVSVAVRVLKHALEYL